MAELLRGQWQGARQLRQVLGGGEPVLAPGAFDALSARIVEAAGFPAVYMTGFGTSAALLGRPDVGLLTQTEMVEAARRIVEAVGVPVIADADTGYGNALNVVRTVREYERAGVAAIHLEDQVLPKRCGHMEGKQLVPTEEMQAKIRAAVEARHDPDFLLIARTDARAVEGLDAAIARAKAYRAAGADVLFVEAPQSREEIERVAHELAGTPLLYNWAEQGKSPPMPWEDLRAMGYALIICPISLLLTATRAMVEAARQMREAKSPLPLLPSLPTFKEFTDFIGLPEVDALDRRFTNR